MSKGREPSPCQHGKAMEPKLACMPFSLKCPRSSKEQAKKFRPEILKKNYKIQCNKHDGNFDIRANLTSS